VLAFLFYSHETMRAVLILALTASLAAGCGQRGPLYLRESPPPGVKPEKPAPYRPVPYPQDTQGEGDANEDRRIERGQDVNRVP
jgi:predicted small lipoprotein YifL